MGAVHMLRGSDHLLRGPVLLLLPFLLSVGSSLRLREDTNFGFSIDQRMRRSRPALIHIRILESHVVRNSCARASPDESSRASSFRSGKHIPCTIHINFEDMVFELSAISNGKRRDDSSSMDDYLGTDFVYYCAHKICIRDIAHFVLYSRIQREWQIQVQYSDRPFRMLLYNCIDDEGA